MTWANHDSCAKNMLTTLAVIEAEQLADRVTVVSRDHGAVRQRARRRRVAAPARCRQGGRPRPLAHLDGPGDSRVPAGDSPCRGGRAPRHA
ncbi:hypothetical protein ACWGSA_29635, partial [Streptomyces diastaticus]